MIEARRFARTDKGHAEITERRKNLRGKLRTVLFLVDPGKALHDIQQQAALLGAPDDALAELVAGGYIVEVGAGAAPAGDVAGGAGGGHLADDELQRFRVAKAFMNDTIVDALGIRAFAFTLRLERCANREDLAALIQDYGNALLKKLDRAEATVLVQRTRELLKSG
jgi:hypothetical protein